MSMIEDGRGSGIKAEINSKHRLTTETVTFDREDDAIFFGVGYQVTSGQVSFPDANAIPMMYIKNDEDQDMMIDRIIMMLGTSTGGTGDWYHKIVRNPATGTIIDNAVAGGISNSNHGSANILNSGLFVYKGVSGDTMTDGGGVPLPVKQSTNRFNFPIGRRIPKGQSIGVIITPPPGNTAAIAVTVMHVYIDTNN